MASTKLNFFYENMQISEKFLKEIEDLIVEFVRDHLKLNTSSTRSQIFTPRKEDGLGLTKPSTMYHAKRVSFLLSVLNSDDPQVRSLTRNSFVLHMQKRKVSAARPGEDNFGGYKVNNAYRLDKNSKTNWPRSAFVELNELCVKMNIRLHFDQDSDLYSIALPLRRYSDPRQLFTALKSLEIKKDLDHWRTLLQQGRLQRETFPYADMPDSIGHLTNSNINDHLTRFIVKGRLQLLETNAVNNTYFPQTYSRSCSLCSFHSDTNSHALNGCRSLRGLHSERHDRCVKLVKNELVKNVVTDFCQVFENQVVTLPGHGVLNSSRPDLCLIDHNNSKAFVIEISNPFDTFVEQCYQHKFNKYMPLCLLLNDAGFLTKIIVIVVGSLGTVHRRVVPGLTLLGLPKKTCKHLAKYMSISTMIGSRRVWARRSYAIERSSR